MKTKMLLLAFLLSFNNYGKASVPDSIVKMQFKDFMENGVEIIGKGRYITSAGVFDFLTNENKTLTYKTNNGIYKYREVNPHTYQHIIICKDSICTIINCSNKYSEILSEFIKHLQELQIPDKDWIEYINGLNALYIRNLNRGGGIEIAVDQETQD